MCYDPSTFPRRSTSLHTDAAGTAPPDAFGPFRVLHQIGAGALGPVFRAYDPEQDKLVAVKWFRLDLPPERTHRLVAQLERLIASDLKHPAIAAPLATGVVGAAPFLAHDFVPADSVDIVIRQQGAPPAEAVRIATQLASALDAAADAGIVHGALHPRDVLVSSDDVRVTGLGIARALELAGSVAAVRRPYTAPERAAGAASWDRRADVFSLAVLVHEWLWSKRVTGIGRQAADALTELPGADLAALRHLFRRALADEPADRLDTALEFADGLKHALTKGPRLETRAPIPSELRLPLDEAEKMETPKVHSPARTSHPGDLDLRHDAEPVRDEGIEISPAFAGPALGTGAADRPFPVERFDGLLDSTRSAVWPLGFALVLGVSVGFAAGYEVASWQRRPGIERAAPGARAPAAEATSGSSVREFTESAVREPAAAATPGTPGGDVAPTPPAARSPSGAGTAAAPAAAGRLLIRSTPAGARVVIDGRDVGETPFTMRDVARGAHTVRVVREGFVADQRRVVISAARPAQSLTIELVRARPAAAAPSTPARGQSAAALTVESRPAGASVFLDGKLIGQTPLETGEVAAGDHTVRLELGGYRHWSSSVRVEAGDRRRVAASLDR